MVGEGGLSSHGSRHAKSHGAKTSTADPLTGPVAEVLGRPHLVLPHIGGDDGSNTEIAEGDQHLLGINLTFRIGNGEGITLLPAVDLGQPGASGGGDVALAAALDQLGHALAEIPEHRHLSPAGLADLRRIDLEVHNPGTGGKGVELARDTVIKTGANGDQQIALRDREVGISGAMHPEHPHRQGIVLVKGSLAHQGGGHRQLVAVSQLRQGSVNTGGDGPPTHVQQGALRLLDEIEGRIEGSRIRLLRLPESIRHHRAGLNRYVIEFLLPHILGDIDQHRARTARSSNQEGLCHHRSQICGIAHHPGVLHDRQGDAEDVGFLEGISANGGARHLASNHHHRHRIHLGGGDPGDQVGRSRP